ncbi:MAG: hypothetical protein HRU30_12700 [Rhodobacteraceae bacterium]|nr:hypothetical protein [Paracoccaceae bacterium]
MPHAELKYSADLEIDAEAILAEVEAVILRHDDGSGECKGRAYPATAFHHSHVILELSLLSKPHRDEAFTNALLTDVEHAVKARIGQRCFFSLSLNYSTGYYVTNEHVAERL